MLENLAIDERLAALERAACHAKWRMGDLSYKLDPSKLEIHRQFEALPGLATFVFEKSRKVGGSFWALCLAFEACIRHPGGRVNYAVGTGKMAAEIVVPLVAKVAKDAPPELKPEYSSATGHVTFPADGPAKGAYIVLFGCDDMAKADRGRGPEAVLNIVDEAAFIPVLRYVLVEVLKPQVIHTRGKTLISSSPPRVPGHEFVRIADAAMEDGRYAHRNIFSPGGLMTPEEIADYLASCAADVGLTVEAFTKTPAYMREVEGKRVIDETLAICKEFSDFENGGLAAAYQGSTAIVGDWERPAGFEYIETFVAVDPGMDDKTGELFGFNDFLAGGVLVIEDEDLLEQAATRLIAESVREHEANLWPGKKPPMRVADDPGKRLCADLYDQHGLSFAPAEKHDREELAVNLMRNKMATGHIRVHRRCKRLIHQLRNAVRAKPGGDMIRTEADSHFDLVSACWYLVRCWNAHRHRNPMPHDWDVRAGQVRYRPFADRKPASAFHQAVLGDTPHGRRMMARRRR